MKRMTLIAALATVAAILLPSATAGAAPQAPLWTKCSAGSGAGNCRLPRGVAVNPATGHVYVLDQGNARIVELTAWGEFVKAWGEDVVRRGGAGNVPGPTEQQEVTVSGSEGTFSIWLGDEGTEQLPFNATAAEVQAALNSLASIDSVGGSVAVSGGPGGSAPYMVRFEGGLEGDDVEQLRGFGSTPAITVSVDTVVQGGGQLEVCRAGAEPTAVCKAGVPSAAPGAVYGPQGIAIDSTGNIYVHEVSHGYTFREEARVFLGNNRVQKFDPNGTFLLAIGREVNLTKVAEREEQEANSEPVTVTAAEENLCTASSGDQCGPGARGSGASEFGVGAPKHVDLEPVGDYVDVDSEGNLYVGGLGRIQVFDPDGTFLEGIPMPEGEPVQALAVASSGALYTTFWKDAGGNPRSEGVVKFGPAGSGEELCTAKVGNPRVLALDRDGNLYVADHDNSTVAGDLLVRKFNPSCGEDAGFTFSEGAHRSSTGLAASSACGIDGVDLYLSNTPFDDSYVRAYGPPPDPNVCPPPAVPPTIASQYATGVGTDAASLGAEINPHFWPDTTYFVEYGTESCAEGGCVQQPSSPGIELGAINDADIPIEEISLQGLQPGTTYHYRFVAQSSGGGPVRGPERTFRTFGPPLPARTDCANQAFRTGASSRLPACRAYEMVSPVDKNGGDVGTHPFTGHALAAAGGDRATYSSLTAFADPVAAPLQNQYLSTRTPSGWTTESISPPRRMPPLSPPGGPTEFKAFSEDLCQSWVVQDTDLALVDGAPLGVRNLYRRHNCGTSPTYELLTPVPPPGGFEEEQESTYFADVVNVSADGSHAAIRAPAPLTPNACKTERVFQSYITSPGGQLRLISLLPGNVPNCTHSSPGNFEQPGDFSNASAYHAVSEDGSTVFWSSGRDGTPIGGDASAGTPDATKLYVRINATRPQSRLEGGECVEPLRACTLAVSEVEGSIFVAADPAGTEAIYLVGSLFPSQATLREFDVAANESALIATRVRSVVGASEDLSRIYFVSAAVLSGEQANSNGDKARRDAPNLYLYDKTTKTFTFVARLGEIEAGAVGSPGSKFPPPSNPATLEPSLRSSRVTPDGEHLAFTSYERLTGYDNTDVVSGQPDAEVFLYDAEEGAAGQLRCISCNPSGARPAGVKVGELITEEIDWAAAVLPGWPNQMRPSRLLGADGSYLFFESFDSLITRDTNGRGDVYEWRQAASEEECIAHGAESYVEPAGGCLSLVSSGQGTGNAEIVDASDSGRDVFITTNSDLLPQDGGLVDVYDARSGGGFPPPPARPAECEGEACQGAVPAPDNPAPASATFQGSGNVRESGRPRCRKSQIRRRGRCRPRCRRNQRSARKRGKARCAKQRGKRAHRKRRANHKRRNAR